LETSQDTWEKAEQVRLYQLNEVLSQQRKDAQKNIQKKQQTYSNDQIRKVTLFHIGDKVLVRRDYAKNSFSTKLDDKWDGPYYIEEPIGHCSFYLHNGLQRLKYPTHASRMKLYHESKEIGTTLEMGARQLNATTASNQDSLSTDGILI
jgi:hypothetical protein